MKMDGTEVKSNEDESNILFEKFVSACQREKTPEMTQILKKTRGYYLKAKPEYINSQEFQKLVALKTEQIINDPRRIYVYMKDVVDEMRCRKVIRTNSSEGPPNKKQKLSSEANDKGEEKDKSVKEEDSEKIDIEAIANHAESRHADRKVRKLSRALKRIDAVIKKLEEKEVDFEEDNDSAYIKLERYKERFCKVHQKLCELTGDTNVAKLTRRIGFSGTDSQEINRCIERFVNKTGKFPDFHDILKLVKSVEESKNMRPETLRRVAEKAFLTVGRQLQKKRQLESWDAVSIFLKNEADPAEEDPELASRLRSNLEESTSRIQEVIDTFAAKQVKDNLEPEVVPDEVADKSEDSGEDELEEGEEDEQEEEDKDYIDKILEGDDSIGIGEDVGMDQESGNDTSGDEDEGKDHGNNEDEREGHVDNEQKNDEDRKDCGSNDEKNGDRKDRDSDEDDGKDLGSDEEKNDPHSDNASSEDEYSKNEDLTLEEYNLKPVESILGPVSPPVLGEVLDDRDYKFVALKTEDENNSPVSPSLIGKDSDCQLDLRGASEGSPEEEEKETKSADDLKIESHKELSSSSSSEKSEQSVKDSEVSKCSSDASISDKHSKDSKKTDCSLDISEVKNSVESTGRADDESAKNTLISTSRSSSESRDSVSPSLLKNHKKEENSKTVTSNGRKSDKKFVVTKIEMKPAEGECSFMKEKLVSPNTKPKSVISRRITSSECVDVITIE